MLSNDACGDSNTCARGDCSAVIEAEGEPVARLPHFATIPSVKGSRRPGKYNLGVSKLTW